MMQKAYLIWELACKDLRLFVADLRGALLCFAVPILLASFFGAVFHHSGSEETARLAVFIVDENHEPLARQVIAALSASPRLKVSEIDRINAQRQLNKQSGGVAVVLKPDFSKMKLASAKDTLSVVAVEILYHPSSALESRVIEGLFTEVALREAAREKLAPLLQTDPDLLLDRPFALERHAVSGSAELATNSYSHSFCGMTLQYLLFWGMDSGLLLLRERRLGIWKRLRAAPLSLTHLLLSKALATAIVALAQIVLTFTFGYLVFGVAINGSWLGFGAMALAAAILSATTGLLVAALGGNEGRARSMAILTILTLSLLGGMWLPSFLMPAWVQQLALVLPTTWAARGLSGVTWQGMGATGAFQCAGILLAFSAVFLAVALWGFTRSEARRCAGGNG